MGLSFLVPKETHALTVTVRWGDYEQTEIEGPDGKPLSIWQRHPREATVPAPLAGVTDPVVHNVPDSGRLQLLVVERVISAQDLEGHLPQGTRSVSVFLVNNRTPIAPRPRPRCGRSWRSTAAGSRRGERASRLFRELAARRPRSYYGSRVSPPTGSTEVSACSPRTVTPSTPSEWRIAPSHGRSANGLPSRSRCAASSSSPLSL